MLNKYFINSLGGISNWQALDSGIIVMRDSLFITSLLFLPLLLLTSLIFTLIMPQQSALWIILILWWFKPVYDRLILSIYSQKLLTSEPQIYAILKFFLTSLFKSSLIHSLVINRINLSRSFQLAVYQLEKQKGSTARERIKVLGLQTISRARSLTMLALLMEVLVNLTIFSMIWYLLPEAARTSLLIDGLVEQQTMINHGLIVTYCLTIFVVEQLYVASGFTLYLSKRVKLEAWDIDLLFHQLANKASEINKGTMS